MFLRIFDSSFLKNCICWILFGTLTIIFDVLEEIIGKVIENRYIGIFPIIDKIIDISRRLPQIIGDFRELSAKLSISVKDFLKLSAILGNYRQNYQYRKWQKNYRKFIVIEKNDLSPTPILDTSMTQCSFNSDPLPAVTALGKRRYKERHSGLRYNLLHCIGELLKLGSKQRRYKEANLCSIEQCTEENCVALCKVV